VLSDRTGLAAFFHPPDGTALGSVLVLGSAAPVPKDAYNGRHGHTASPRKPFDPRRGGQLTPSPTKSETKDEKGRR